VSWGPLREKTPQTDEPPWVAATVQTVTLKVEMMCEGCAGAVRRILQKVEGASRSPPVLLFASGPSSIQAAAARPSAAHAQCLSTGQLPHPLAHTAPSPKSPPQLRQSSPTEAHPAPPHTMRARSRSITGNNWIAEARKLLDTMGVPIREVGTQARKQLCDVI
jgi:copper chaperone CopZ